MRHILAVSALCIALWWLIFGWFVIRDMAHLREPQTEVSPRYWVEEDTMHYISRSEINPANERYIHILPYEEGTDE